MVRITLWLAKREREREMSDNLELPSSESMQGFGATASSATSYQLSYQLDGT